MKTVDIYRKEGTLDVFVATVKPDSSSNQLKKVMGDNQVTLNFEDNRPIQFKINDYCTIYGENYYLSSLPVVVKSGTFDYRYTLTMRAEGYDLSKVLYLFLGSDNSLRETEFSLMGTANDFIDLLINNANRVSTGWTKGQVINSGYKNLTFSKENCYNALSRLSEEFETEFSIEGKVIHLTKRAVDTGHTYKHGRNKGLYEITRQNLNNSSLVTRLYAYGSEKNLPPSYITTGKRLRLPGGYNPCLISSLTCTVTDNGDGTQTFEFLWDRPLSSNVASVEIEYRLSGSTGAWSTSPGSFLTPPAREVTIPLGNYEFRFRTDGATCSGINAVTPAVEITSTITTPIFVYTPLPFLERNTGIYGVIEYTEIFEDIYPHRTGRVTSVNVADPFEFTDSNIDFDVNAQLLPGLTAKVTFNTGQLAGYTFDVQSFDNGLKRFKIHKNADERILEVPSSTMRPAIGDEYVVIDIEMPSSYVTDAENSLQAAAEARLIELSEPQLSYNIVFDPKFMKRINRVIKTGDLVWIVDAELEIQKKIRVVSVTRGLLEEYQFQVELADIVSPGTISLLVSSQNGNERDIAGLTDAFLNNSILNNTVIGSLTFSNIPTTNTTTGFSQIMIEDSTGKLYKKI